MESYFRIYISFIKFLIHRFVDVRFKSILIYLRIRLKAATNRESVQSQFNTSIFLSLRYKFLPSYLCIIQCYGNGQLVISFNKVLSQILDRDYVRPLLNSVGIYVVAGLYYSVLLIHLDRIHFIFLVIKLPRVNVNRIKHLKW